MSRQYTFSFQDKLKKELLDRLIYSENLQSYKTYHLLRGVYKINKGESNPHIDHKRKIIFIHNPKAGGTTLRQVLNLPKNGTYHHYTPTFLVSKGIWEEYFSIVSIRNPLDRFVSAYFNFVNKKYTGYFRRVYPNLPNLTPIEFLEICKKEPFLSAPQYRYTRHYLSTKPIDFIIRLENIEKDLKILTKLTGIETNYKSVPHLGRRKYDKNKILKDKELVLKIKEYYRFDYNIFGYMID